LPIGLPKHGELGPDRVTAKQTAKQKLMF